MSTPVNENRVVLLTIALLVLSPLSFSQFTPNVQIIDCGVTKDESNYIVNKHNEYRKLIATGKVPNQPRGIDLKEVKWDDRLADEAERIAKLGIFKHKKVFDQRWNYVGQNIHMHSSSRNTADRNWDRCLSSWFEEHKLFNYGPFVHADKVGHYTQMIWADTEYVGCGYCFYKNDTTPAMPFRKLYVCNYGPAGNYIGHLPYKTGYQGCEDLC